MATRKQIEANRRNAQKSCGPKSPETKAVVSQNRTTHGLCGQFRVMPLVESQEEYNIFQARMIEDEQPVGQAEIELVIKMAESTWCSKRALKMQGLCFIPQPKTAEQEKNRETPMGVTDNLELALRYQAAHDRAYQKASNELRKRKKERRLAEIGFESQKRKEAEEIRKVEKHQVALATAQVRKQRLDMKFGCEVADALPPGFDLSSLNEVLSGAAPQPITPFSDEAAFSPRAED